jgi:proline iminopeptidase
MTACGTHVEIRGTRLYVYDMGPVDAPTLVYLHGGPGMGCHEFVRWQGEALAQELRVIAFDQRGSHHSDPVPDDQDLNEDILVRDCEALRDKLGIEQWFLLGHSFGARLATRYATRYPERVRGVIFENPGWDIDSTERYRLPALAGIFQAHGMNELADTCLELAGREHMFPNGFSNELAIHASALGEAWYLYDRTDITFLDRAGLPPLNPRSHLESAYRLRWHPDWLEDLIPLLDGMRAPARLILGEADLVTSPNQVDAFTRVFGAAQVTTVAKAGHIVQGEQPDIYTRLVLDFVQGSHPTPSAVREGV